MAIYGTTLGNLIANSDSITHRDRTRSGPVADTSPGGGGGGGGGGNVEWATIINTPATLAGYGITDGVKFADLADVATSGLASDVAFASGAGLTSLDVAAALDELKGLTVAGASPLTTKGDLYGFSTVKARVPVGANGEVLTADSTVALGVKWAAVAGGGGSSWDVRDSWLFN